MSALLAWFYTAEPKLADMSYVSGVRERQLRVKQAREEELTTQLERVRDQPKLPRWLLQLTRQDIWPEIVRRFEHIDGFTPEELRVVESNLGVQVLGTSMTVADVIGQMPLGYVLQTARYLRGSNLTRQTIRTEPVNFGDAPRPVRSYIPRDSADESNAIARRVPGEPGEEKYVDPVDAGESLADLEPGVSDVRRGPGRPPLGEGQEAGATVSNVLDQIQPDDQVLDVVGKLSRAVRVGSLLYDRAFPAWSEAWRNAVESESGMDTLTESLGLPADTDIQTVNNTFVQWIKNAVVAYRKKTTTQPRIWVSRTRDGKTINGYGLGRPGPTIRSAYSRFHMV